MVLVQSDSVVTVQLAGLAWQHWPKGCAAPELHESIFGEEAGASNLGAMLKAIENQTNINQPARKILQVS